MKVSLRKFKPLVLLLIISFSVLVPFSFLQNVQAEIIIVSMTPSTGNVGTSVQLSANISTVDGTFLIQFDGENITSGVASGNIANVSFSIPHALQGAHNVTIVDTTNQETNSTIFDVTTSYSISPVLPESPAQIQEGANVTVSVNMTGGTANFTYPSIFVQMPFGNLTYQASKNVTTNTVGDFIENLTYPYDFASGANTNFTGVYRILFNETIANQFFIGITNSSEYHRGETVNIKAVDYYPPNENVTLNTRYAGSIIDSVNSTALNGVVTAEWTVPLNATIGDYNITITPVPNSKRDAPDKQVFEILGFKTEILTLNLAEKAVSGVFVNAYETSTRTYYNATSDEDGLAVIMLETGSYTSEAFFKNVRVGELNFTITMEERLNFTCQLTTLNISVTDSNNVIIPSVSISLTYNYTTNLGEKQNRTGIDEGATEINGILQLSLLPNVTYMINASRYGVLFNQGNDVVSNLPAAAYFDVNILCPARILQVKAVDALNRSIADVTIVARDLMGGLDYSATTDAGGLAILQCTFGRYFVKVYADRILLNETTVDLFQDQNVSIVCAFYDLSISVQVVDYFGQPIGNVNVTLQRQDFNALSGTTGSDGIVTFNNIIGDNIQLDVCLPGQTQLFESGNFSADSSKTIQIRADRYILLAGALVETSQFATVIIVVLTALLVVGLEIYRRRSSPKSQAQVNNENKES